MNGTIPLHKDRGLDPHLTYCQRCGGDVEELTIGEVKEITLPDGRKTYVNRGKVHKVCKKLGYSPYECTIRNIEDHERLPASQPCNKCQKELETFDNIVKEGGVYFKCTEWGSTGVIKADTEFAKAVRKTSKVEAPDPIGIEFTKCIEHTTEKVGT